MTAATSKVQTGGPSPARVVTSIIAFTTAGLLPQAMVGTLALQMRASLHFSAGELGAAASIIYASASLVSIPGAKTVERLGGAEVMRLLSMVIAFGCLGVALLARSWILLAPFLVLFGIGLSVTPPAVNLLLWRHIPAERRGTAFGLKQAAAPLSTLLAGLAVPAIALTIGWRWAFVFAALIALATGAAVPRSANESREIQAAKPPVVRPPLRPLIVLAAGFGLGFAACTSLAIFLVSGGFNVGLSKAHAGLLVSLASLFGLIVRVACGFLIDRREGRFFVLIAAMLGIGGLGFLGLAFASAHHLVGLFVPSAVIALSIGWGWNGVFNYAVVHSFPDAAAWSTGVTQTGGQAGSVVGPLVFGLVVTEASYSVAWLVCVGEGVAAAIAMVIGGVLVARARRPVPAAVL